MPKVKKKCRIIRDGPRFARVVLHYTEEVSGLISLVVIVPLVIMWMTIETFVWRQTTPVKINDVFNMD